MNLYINMVFIISSTWSITYLYSFTDTGADGNVSRDVCRQVVLETALRRRNQNFKFLNPSSLLPRSR